MPPQTTAATSNLVTTGDLADHVASFVHALTQENLSTNTIVAYATALRELAQFLAAHGYATDIRRIEPHHIDEWRMDLLERHKPAIAHNRFRTAQRFFNWYAETNKSFASPMRGMRPPGLPEYSRDLSLEQQQDVIRACQGPAFEDRRDLALVRVFFSTGARRAEIANVRYSPSEPADLDLDRGTVRFIDNSQRERIVSLDTETLAALRDYVGARSDHPHADLPWLWLGTQGHLNDSGVGRALWARGMRAGIPGLHRLGHGIWIA